MDSYSVLLRVGFTLPHLLPDARCALTAPFHPYLILRRFVFCGTFRRLAPPRRYLAPCPLEPGLSSISRYLPMAAKDSDYLVDSPMKPYLCTQSDSSGILVLGIKNLVVDYFFSQAEARSNRICQKRRSHLIFQGVNQLTNLRVLRLFLWHSPN